MSYYGNDIVPILNTAKYLKYNLMTENFNSFQHKFLSYSSLRTYIPYSYFLTAKADTLINTCCSNKSLIHHCAMVYSLILHYTNFFLQVSTKRLKEACHNFCLLILPHKMLSQVPSLMCVNTNAIVLCIGITYATTLLPHAHVANGMDLLSILL